MRIPASALLLPGLVVALTTAAPADAADLQPGTYKEALRCAAIDTIFAAVMQIDDAPESKQKGEALDAKTRKWLMVADALKPGNNDELAADYAKEASEVGDLAMGSDNTEVGKDLEHCMEREAALFP